MQNTYFNYSDFHSFEQLTEYTKVELIHNKKTILGRKKKKKKPSKKHTLMTPNHSNIYSEFNRKTEINRKVESNLNCIPSYNKYF